MMVATAMSIPIMIFLLLGVAVPVLIGVFVYRDAKARSMEPVLWTLVAVLVPSFIGLIVYLIVRSGHAADVCAQCGQPVQDSYLRCPSCGAYLKYDCPSCGAPVDAGWRLCAHCGAELEQGRPSPVIRRSGGSFKGLWIVLALAAVVAAVFLLLASLTFARVQVTNDTTQTAHEVVVDGGYEAEPDGSGEPGQISALE